MRFFSSKHCTSRSHCQRCRDKEGGRAWRAKIRKLFSDVKSDDFACPAGVEWAEVVPPKVRYSHFLSLHKEILEESDDAWLISLAIQCHAMYMNIPPDLTCKNKKAYRDRWYKKLKYYNGLSISKTKGEK